MITKTFEKAPPDEVTGVKKDLPISNNAFNTFKENLDMLEEVMEKISPKEVLIAWMMDEDIGTPQDINPIVLEMNAHLSNGRWDTAEELVTTLDTLDQHIITNAAETGLDPAIEDSIEKLKGQNGTVINELMRLNAAKKTYQLVYPKEKS